MKKKRKVKVVVHECYNEWFWDIVGENGRVIGCCDNSFPSKHNAVRSAKLLGLPIEVKEWVKK